ncbi:hypothetical protein BDQ12DRAFT_676335 [Crucibulum laeve]|uniref:Proteasome assembly chaperone 3 n=1 Tax=Crucibulum laeve TaxID=68775 RepID=A0A5C3MAM4_9AGAR|nr:hypothetical protein BDQ12DRAFT_676335 [Crucibulum laeve]
MAMFTPRQISREISGNITEIMLQTFADRVLVLVTQIGKVGNLIQASIPPTIPLSPAPASDPSRPNHRPLPPPPPAIQLTSLLGTAASQHMQTLHSLYAAQIATIVWTEKSQGGLEALRRSVVVGLALKKSDGNEDTGVTQGEKTLFESVMEMLQDLLAQE